MLAPDTASAVERRLDDGAGSRIGRLPAGYRAWCVNDLPESWLPVLAWALSVELWDPAWSAAERRAAILGAADLHREKGTPARSSGRSTLRGQSTITRRGRRRSCAGSPSAT